MIKTSNNNTKDITITSQPKIELNNNLVDNSTIQPLENNTHPTTPVITQEKPIKIETKEELKIRLKNKLQTKLQQKQISRKPKIIQQSIFDNTFKELGIDKEKLIESVKNLKQSDQAKLFDKITQGQMK